MRFSSPYLCRNAGSNGKHFGQFSAAFCSKSGRQRRTRNLSGVSCSGTRYVYVSSMCGYGAFRPQKLTKGMLEVSFSARVP